MDKAKATEEPMLYKSSNAAYTFNLEQIAYIDSSANENGEYTIYFSGGLTVTVPQQVYDEVYAALNK